MMENGHPLATPHGKTVQNIFDVFQSGIIKFVTFKKIEYFYINFGQLSNPSTYQL